jgi:hypothetical protein
MIDGHTPLTDAEIDRHLTNIEAAADFLRGMKRAPRPEPSGPWITPSQATAICGRSESQVRRDCELNLIDAGGFAMKRGGRWFIDKEIYTEMRGHARFRR